MINTFKESNKMIMQSPTKYNPSHQLNWSCSKNQIMPWKKHQKSVGNLGIELPIDTHIIKLSIDTHRTELAINN